MNREVQKKGNARIVLTADRKPYVVFEPADGSAFVQVVELPADSFMFTSDGAIDIDFRSAEIVPSARGLLSRDTVINEIE